MTKTGRNFRSTDELHSSEIFESGAEVRRDEIVTGLDVSIGFSLASRRRTSFIGAETHARDHRESFPGPV